MKKGRNVLAVEMETSKRVLPIQRSFSEISYIGMSLFKYIYVKQALQIVDLKYSLTFD